MTDNTTPAFSADDDGLRATVTHYGSLSGKSEGIPAEHQPYAEQVLKMDSLRDVAGNVADNSGVVPTQLKVDSLPHEMRSEVYRKLELLPNMPKEELAKHESKLVAEAITAKRGSIRSLTGVHPDSLPFHKEQANIAMQVRDLYRKHDDYQSQMDKVVDVKKAEDPVTGELVAEPVYWLSETKRANFANAIADIDRQIRLLMAPDGSFGLEGRKRMDKALAESAAILHKIATHRTEEREAQKLADEIVSKERIQRRAEVLASQKRNSSS
ncbi:hypothetical protein G6N82_06770 [Altererythrobacter sp. BO-6]|uniref:hypothetical protein n=1 Tax=Altererythrobacter sp. BO-6 TaxID=2604537 RepID=UPI0013E1D10A|nr:hypothetical protein [Altererythrobacter sp. BO-6]QIG53896.1 hypothetical protein G6N82_06770 [Altererythrobacter sp. BO-6]